MKRKLKLGFRKHFMLNFGCEYYDGPIWYLNLGWFWVNYRNYPW